MHLTRIKNHNYEMVMGGVVITNWNRRGFRWKCNFEKMSCENILNEDRLSDDFNVVHSNA